MQIQQIKWYLEGFTEFSPLAFRRLKRMSGRRRCGMTHIRRWEQFLVRNLVNYWFCRLFLSVLLGHFTRFESMYKLIHLSWLVQFHSWLYLSFVFFRVYLPRNEDKFIGRYEDSALMIHNLKLLLMQFEIIRNPEWVSIYRHCGSC